MKIVKNLLPKDKYELKCPYTMKPEFIVVHNTANDASAENEINYMIGNDSSTGFHFAVDDKEVVQGIPLDRNAFHAGDGKNGKGNRKGISIEICYSKSGGEKFDKAEKNAVELIEYLLDKYGWDKSKVTKHQDYSGKDCPHRTLEKGWQRFLDMINAGNAAGDTGGYKIKVTADLLNYRSGAGTQYEIKGQIKQGEVYTIVEENNGWGRLKSGAGWINLKYTARV